MPFQPRNDDDEELDAGVLEGEEETEARVAEDKPENTRLPEAWMEDGEVEALNVPYSTRAPTDWVIQGPLGKSKAWRPNERRFSSWAAAEKWAREKYGPKFKGPVMDALESGCGRWAFLIKKLGD